VLEHAVGSMLQFAGKFQGGRVPVSARASALLPRHLDHLARIDSALNTIRESVATAIGQPVIVTIEEGEVTKRLAAWAAIFAVATAFAGIWGMNFEHMPELKFAYGYPAALALITGTGTYLWWRFRRAGWL
jgi:magnesium transporter